MNNIRKRKNDGKRKGDIKYVSPSEISAKALRKPNSQIVGRPSQYPAVKKRLVYNLYLMGLTDEEVAACLDISRETLISWKKKYPEFLNTIKQAKAEPDAKVVRALYQRALGSKIHATKFFQTKDGDVLAVKHIEHYPPDTAAMIFWLKNRHPKLFRDKPEQEDDGAHKPMEINVNVITSQEKLNKLDNEDGDQEASDK